MMTVNEALEEAADKVAEAFMEAALKIPPEDFCKTFCSHNNGVPNDS